MLVQEETTDEKDEHHYEGEGGGTPADDHPTQVVGIYSGQRFGQRIVPAHTARMLIAGSLTDPGRRQIWSGGRDMPTCLLATDHARRVMDIRLTGSAVLKPRAHVGSPTLRTLATCATYREEDTDSRAGYAGLDECEHQTVNHAVEHVVGEVHTNTIESFWALLKRGLTGTYISVEPYHLFRYLDERMFAYNQREQTDLGRFAGVLAAVSGRRVTWNELTGQA
jgi:hypothetical protein